MFEATYLGWQGWLLASPQTRLLVDPLLVDEVGNGPRNRRLDFHFWPPRAFDFTALPPVDAVFLTHEHEDHFSVASLARVDRSVPVWLSSRSSRAARRLLEEMGFGVRLVAPDAALRLGDLEVRLFGPDHSGPFPTNEWDTLAYGVRDLRQAGAFFTNVDIDVTDAARQIVSGWSERGGAEVLLFEGMEVALAPASPVGRHLEAREMHAAGRDTPFFEGPSLAGLKGGARFKPLAGQSFRFEAGALVGAESAPFLRTAPRASWPPKPRFRRAPSEPLEPYCGDPAFDEADWPELEAGLARIAEHLYGHYLFRRLYSLDERALEGRKPTFVWVLRLDAEGGACALEYDPTGCSFEPVDAAADLGDLRYVGAATCWATDLLALLRGEFEARAIVKAFHEAWHPSCPLVSLLTDVLWGYFHPLRHPEATLRRYRAAAADEAGAPLCVRAPRAEGGPA
ncbi:MAG TPA: MBL fold metallo-hydrolase [Polyangiaceae bacterium]|nr:MBL fold metallo-hydrolase [Polyangiaceae bacterium]